MIKIGENILESSVHEFWPLSFWRRSCCINQIRAIYHRSREKSTKLSLKKVTCTDFKNRLFFIILFSARWRHPKQTVSLERSRPGQCRSEFEGQQTSWRQVGRVLQNVKKLRKKWRWRRDTLIQNPPEIFIRLYIHVWITPFFTIQ